MEFAREFKGEPAIVVDAGQDHFFFDRGIGEFSVGECIEENVRVLHLDFDPFAVTLKPLQVIEIDLFRFSAAGPEVEGFQGAHQLGEYGFAIE